MRLLRKILNHLLLIVSASTLVQADPRDLLQEFLERDAVISQRVISKEALAVDVRGEREALITEINGRLAGEGYQLGWTQNFGIERDISEERGWKIYPGQGYVYDAESGIVSGKGFILSQTFERGIFGDLPIIVGGTYERINRELAFRLNIIHDKTLLGPSVTKHWNTQVFAPEGPVEGSEVTVQFLNGAYQPLQVCARILSAGILVPKVEDRASILSHLVFGDDFPLPREEEAFALMPQLVDRYESRFWGVKPSDLYAPAGLVMPKFPMYHPYHPFINVTAKDDILQVPLAVPLLNWSSMVPLALLKRLSEIKVPITPFFVVQSLPYGPGTDVIARYQYGLFPEGKGVMKGTQAIFAQGIIYERNEELAHFPATQITIHESKKDEVSPTILSGNSMKLGTVDNLRGKGLWSLVLGSPAATLGENGLFAEVTHAYLGYTLFLENEDEYVAFLHFMRDKSPREFYDHIPALLAGREGVSHVLGK